MVIHSEFPGAPGIVPPKALLPQKSSICCHLNLVEAKVFGGWPNLASHGNFKIINHGLHNDRVVFYLIRRWPANKRRNMVTISPSITQNNLVIAGTSMLDLE